MYIACRIKTNIRHQPIILQRYNVAANKPISGINQSLHRGALFDANKPTSAINQSYYRGTMPLQTNQYSASTNHTTEVQCRCKQTNIRHQPITP